MSALGRKGLVLIRGKGGQFEGRLVRGEACSRGGLFEGRLVRGEACSRGGLFEGRLVRGEACSRGACSRIYKVYLTQVFVFTKGRHESPQRPDMVQTHGMTPMPPMMTPEMQMMSNPAMAGAAVPGSAQGITSFFYLMLNWR